MRGLNWFAAHLAPLIRPRVSDSLDYEAGLVVVIGKRAKHMTLANAASCIAGYTCCNEGSIRDHQRHTRNGTWARISMRPAVSDPGW